MRVRDYRTDPRTQGSLAFTLKPEYIGKNDSGWTIIGNVHEDYLEWINEFVAFHPEYHIVAGNFEKIILYTSEEGLTHFMENHPPQEWDYHDI